MYFTIINEFRCRINYVLLKYFSSTTLILKLSTFLLNALAYIKFTHTPVEKQSHEFTFIGKRIFQRKANEGIQIHVHDNTGAEFDVAVQSVCLSFRARPNSLFDSE